MPARLLHICLADDHPDDCFLFTEAIKDSGRDITHSCFYTCPALLEHLKLGKNLPDIILLDLNMPGNDGFECLRAIKEMPVARHIPVIIYSTASTPSIIAAAQACGAAQYIRKPTTMQGLYNIIGELTVTYGH